MVQSVASWTMLPFPNVTPKQTHRTIFNMFVRVTFIKTRRRVQNTLYQHRDDNVILANSFYIVGIFISFSAVHRNGTHKSRVDFSSMLVGLF